MLSINTNLSSLIAQNSMKTSTNKLNEAIERMSTGYKINHAKDNAANYSISTNMTTRMSAYQVAEDNVAMGMDLIMRLLFFVTQSIVSFLRRSVVLKPKEGSSNDKMLGQNPTAGHTHRGNQNRKRHVYLNVHRSTVYNSQDMEAT